ncbi:glycosyltransferase family 2 protein [Sphingobium sp.]|uniref:glycosyltransferase family 2 protein n=1 Tax=Sphingobium sp. TaxID=1912891 RepID=UPI003B3BBE8A
MKISFTLCTKNGGERLGICLDHIEAMEADADLELFLVDNGSTDGTSYQRLLRFAERTRFRCQVLQTLVPGNSAGRNVAVERASGDIHIFIDDDCYVAPDFLREWTRIFTDRPDLGFASGMVTRYDLRYSDLGCVEHPHERRIEPYGFVPRGFIQGSNMAFRRQCLADAGRFDIRLGAGTPFAGEEWDMCLRASRKGWAGGYFPQPRVAHDHRRVESESHARMLYYDFGGGLVYAKNSFVKSWVRTLHEFGHEMKKLWRANEKERFFTFARGYLRYFFIWWPVRR